jgi:hypothetical protein
LPTRAALFGHFNDCLTVPLGRERRVFLLCTLGRVPDDVFGGKVAIWDENAFYRIRTCSGG